ncbi:AcrR family transcriptional regulator [Pseudomonas sp. BT76 TE3572]|nr:TetR/AcrR family transcriptional regulator [Pseudomonas mandelii]
MARPRSDTKRNAIMSAAIKTIAAKGLSAPTAMIAKEAGVSNGALFTYFETKSDLLNELYLQLKADMAKATTTDLPTEASVRDQMLHVWNRWLHWTLSHPQERRAIAYLGVSHDVTQASHEAASRFYSGVAELLDRSRAYGPMRDAPLMYVGSLVMALVDVTTNYMASDMANAEKHASTGFEALWRIVA